MYSENKKLEIKENYSDSILKTVSAYSNDDGGIILIGITDQGSIKGVSNSRELRLKLENKINDSIQPRPIYTLKELIIEGKTLVEINVSAGFQVPYLYQGLAYQRHDTSTVPVDKDTLFNLMLKGKNISYDQTESMHQHLEFKVLETYLKEKKEIKSINEDILKTMGLIKNNKYTLAAELIADDNETFGIDIVKFGHSISEFTERLTASKKSILTQYEKAIMMYEKYYPSIDYVSGLERKEKVQVPKVAYREAIANAIVHRDYMKQAPIKVSYFDNRIEIHSPGGLPEGITVENYLNDQVSIARNTIIAQSFYTLGLIEKFGTGIKRMMESYRLYDLKPKFIIKDEFIKVILPNLSFDDKKLLPIERILNYLDLNLEITRSGIEQLLEVSKYKAIEYIETMIKEGLLEKIGSGPNIKYFKKV